MTSNGVIVFDLVQWHLVFLGFGRGFPISTGLRSKSPTGGGSLSQAGEVLKSLRANGVGVDFPSGQCEINELLFQP